MIKLPTKHALSSRKKAISQQFKYMHSLTVHIRDNIFGMTFTAWNLQSYVATAFSSFSHLSSLVDMYISLGKFVSFIAWQQTGLHAVFDDTLLGR